VTSASRILPDGRQHAGYGEIQADPYSSSRLMDTFEKELALEKQHLSPDDFEGPDGAQPGHPLYRSGVEGEVPCLSDAEGVPVEKNALLVKRSWTSFQTAETVSQLRIGFCSRNLQVAMVGDGSPRPGNTGRLRKFELRRSLSAEREEAGASGESHGC